MWRHRHKRNSHTPRKHMNWQPDTKENLLQCTQRLCREFTAAAPNHPYGRP
eukprot:jgi/Botrbrau1/10788/Bobra.0119s0014.1